MNAARVGSHTMKGVCYSTPKFLNKQSINNEVKSFYGNIFNVTFFRQILQTYREIYYSYNGLNLHSDSAWFESQSQHRLFWLIFVMILLKWPWQVSGFRLNHNRFLPNPFEFIIRKSSFLWCCAVWGPESAVKLQNTSTGVLFYKLDVIDLVTVL